MSKDERLRDLHNKGERDASKGRYRPPHGIFDELTTWSSDGMKRHREENEAYKAGMHNTKTHKGDR